MDESAIKGLKVLELNDASADIQKPRSISIISVEGYDTWRQAYHLKLEVEKHFASCGRIIHTCFPVDYERGILESVGFIRIEGEGVAEKALELNGTDVGGWTAIVKAPGNIVTMRDRRPKYNTERFSVRGYDTSLPEIDIQMALCTHFSLCGEIRNIMVLSSCGASYIYISGETCVSKALGLDGSSLGGRTLVVKHVSGRTDYPRTPTGYVPQSSLLELAEKKQKEKEKEMEKKLEKEKEKEKEKERKMGKKKKMKIVMEMKMMMKKKKKMKMKMMMKMEKKMETLS